MASLAAARPGGGQAGDGTLRGEFSFNAARAAKFPDTSFLVAVVVSIAAACPVSTLRLCDTLHLSLRNNRAEGHAKAGGRSSTA